MSTTPSRFGFHGREKELAWLRSHFDAVALRAADGKFSGPRMACIVGESGIGKSRLVQELYIRLANDPQWDPHEVSYWPNAFGEGLVGLSVAPDMHGHAAMGPPRFLWLGARACDPGNLHSEQGDPLARLSSALRGHAEVFDGHCSAWSRISTRAAETVQGELDDAIAKWPPLRSRSWKLHKHLKLEIEARARRSFLAALALKLGKSVLHGGRARDEAQGSADTAVEIAEQVRRPVVDDLLDSFRLLLGAEDSVPTVLWLDDAHQADEEARRFVTELWEQASRCRWPLLIVVTHGEREWRIRKLDRFRCVSPDARDFVGFEGRDGVDVLVLESATAAALASWLADCLPALTPRHRALLLERAPADFHRLVEDFGGLLSNPGNFEGGDARSSLSDAGECVVRAWASDRNERSKARATDSAELRRHLVEWINNSFDGQGNDIWPDGEKGIAAPERSVTGLGDDARRDVLVMARRELALPAAPDWSKPEDLAAARAVYLRAICDDRAKRGHRLSEPMRSLAEWPFGSMPVHVLSVGCLNRLFRAARTAGHLQIAGRVADVALAEQHRLLSELETPDRLRGVSEGLENIGSVLEALGDWPAALDRYEQGLAIARRLFAEEATADRLRAVNVGVSNVGGILEELGEWHGALDRYEESLAITRRLLAEEATADRVRDVSVSLENVGRVLEALGDRRGALDRYEQSLALARRVLAEDETRERLRDVIVGLFNVGGILEARSDWRGALARYDESLAISRRLLAEEETPESLRQLSVILLNVGGILEARSDWPGALDRYEESLRISRRLLAEEETSERLFDVSVCLSRVGRILEARSDRPGALERFEESLGIARRVLAQGATAEHRRRVGACLNDVGRILEFRNDLDDALERYEEGVGIARCLLAEEETAGHMRDLSVGLTGAGNILRKRGDLVGALERYEESLEITRRLLAEEETPGRLRDRSVGLNNVGWILEARYDLPAALKLYEESLEIARRLLAEEVMAERLRDVSVSLNNVGRILEARQDRSGALELYEESLGIRRDLLAKGKSGGRQLDVRENLESIGRILAARGDWSGALALYEESLEIRRRQVYEFPMRACDWRRDFLSLLTTCRDAALEVHAFERAHGLALEMWILSPEKKEDSPRARAYLLSLAIPLLRCEIALARLPDAAETASAIEEFVCALVDAFRDDAVDRVEQQLDSMTLIRCAEGMELVGRLRGLEGDQVAMSEAVELANLLREYSQELDADECARASGETAP